MTGWTPATALQNSDDSFRNEIARFASIRVVDHKLLIAGNDIQARDATTIFARFGKMTLLEVAARARELPIPSGHFQFIMPQIASGPGRRIHLMWGEDATNTSQEQADWLTQPVNEIWTAEYFDGRWSEAHLLYKGQVRWGKPKSGAIASNGAMAAIAVATAGVAPQADLLVFSNTGNKWKIDSLFLEVSARPVYTSTAVIGARIHIGYIAGSFTVPSDRNSVWTISQSEDGQWRRPILLNLSGKQPATYVHVSATPETRAQIVWLQERDSGNQIAHALEIDSSRWTRPDTVAIDGSFLNAATVAANDGTLHIVFENFPKSPQLGSLSYIVWANGWKAAQFPFQNVMGHDPALAVDENGDIVLAFLGWRGESVTGPMQIMTARLPRTSSLKRQ